MCLPLSFLSAKQPLLPNFATAALVSQLLDATDPLGASGENISASATEHMRRSIHIRVPRAWGPS